MKSTTNSYPGVSQIFKTSEYLNTSGGIPKSNTNKVEK